MPAPARLAEYRRKRDLSVTPEPQPGPVAASFALPRFVVQLHHARRRHFDFRLEVAGTLRSWAVPKGPSLQAGLRRLAVEVEDHPLEYGDFEGDIPAGHYGAGHVAIWDRGHWECDEDPAQSLAQGRLQFDLHGQRLRGRFTLVRTDGAAKQTQWLLIKGRDRWAQDGHVADDQPLADAHTEAAPSTPKRKPAQTSLPDANDLQLAQIVNRVPARGKWLHEIKYDGYRLLLRRQDREISLLSRGGQDWTVRLPQLAAALCALPCRNVVLDGELVALSAEGRSEFGRLQESMGRHGDSAALRVFAFDLLWLDGVDLRAQPLQERRARLEALLRDVSGSALLLSPAIEGNSAAIYREACRQGLEGIVSKALDAPYRADRDGSWLKLKCKKSDEFAVVGYTRGSGARTALGALLLASPAGHQWRYRGKVGSGLTDTLVAQLPRQLVARRKPVALINAPLSVTRVSWVEPSVVVEVEHRGLTAGGLLRQGALKGLRPDVRIAALREVPDSETVIDAATSAPTLTHPDRKVFTDPPFTKRQLADFYDALAEPLLRELRRRPLSLLRCPDGSGGECFFQRHTSAGFGPAVREAVMPSARRGEKRVLYIEDAAGLHALVQMGAIELHGAGVRLDDPLRPDQIVFDLDPGTGVPWAQVIAAARLIRARMDTLDLPSFVRTSGGKGLHIVLPLTPRAGWDEVRGFAQATALALSAEFPERFVAVAGESRRRGRIFIDWLRNAPGASSIATWSVRARPGAPVATPLDWDELGRVRSAAQFHVRNIQRRRARGKDPWADFDAQRRPLPEIDDGR